jgi:hypothetical protein
MSCPRAAVRSGVGGTPGDTGLPGRSTGPPPQHGHPYGGSTPIAVHENGPVPDPARLQSSGARGGCCSTPGRHGNHLTVGNSLSHLRWVCSHSHVITRDRTTRLRLTPRIPRIPRIPLPAPRASVRPAHAPRRRVPRQGLRGGGPVDSRTRRRARPFRWAVRSLPQDRGQPTGGGTGDESFVLPDRGEPRTQQVGPEAGSHEQRGRPGARGPQPGGNAGARRPRPGRDLLVVRASDRSGRTHRVEAGLTRRDAAPPCGSTKGSSIGVERFCSLSLPSLTLVGHTVNSETEPRSPPATFAVGTPRAGPRTTGTCAHDRGRPCASEKKQPQAVRG